MKRERVKTAVKVFTYSYIDIYDKQYFRDKKKSNTKKQLFKKCMVLKPGKGKGKVLMNKGNYQDAGKTKFKIIQNDSTFTRLKTVHNYMNDVSKHNEITEAQLGRAHGLNKNHGAFTNIPKFRPIIDTTKKS